MLISLIVKLFITHYQTPLLHLISILQLLFLRLTIWTIFVTFSPYLDGLLFFLFLILYQRYPLKKFFNRNLIHFWKYLELLFFCFSLPVATFSAFVLLIISSEPLRKYRNSVLIDDGKGVLKVKNVGGWTKIFYCEF